MEFAAVCPVCGTNDWAEASKDEGIDEDGTTYVRYECCRCGYETDWQMLPD